MVLGFYYNAISPTFATHLINLISISVEDVGNVDKRDIQESPRIILVGM